MTHQVIFGNVHAYVDEAEQNLDQIQNQINTLGHSDHLANLEILAHVQLENALKKQNSFWREKA